MGGLVGIDEVFRRTDRTHCTFYFRSSNTLIVSNHARGRWYRPNLATANPRTRIQPTAVGVVGVTLFQSCLLLHFLVYTAATSIKISNRLPLLRL